LAHCTMEYGSRVADGYGIRRDEGCGNGLLPAMSVLSVRVLLVGKGGHVEVPTPFTEMSLLRAGVLKDRRSDVP
jgi:hypothetical protein